jgi:hypothetical protein
MVFILLAIWQLKNSPKAKVFGTRAPDKGLVFLIPIFQQRLEI